ncbi:putative protein-lysine deacylase ABHD14B [Saccostrea echinata]|uniref:putative protein-lysine deacylase ABHD14B n=1 Tax=Saccostrea echinata TaxID=191078 RepID=UPI002A8196CF|nr:putative protein-lysine deacylase ABHD14B [Saccostrea echinata]
MSPSGIHVNKTVVLFVLAITAIIVVYKNYKYIGTFLKFGGKKEGMTSIPKDALDKAKTLKVEERKVKVELKDGKSVDIVVREVIPTLGVGDILFLHGQAFSSKDWEKIDTLTIFSALGYHPVAVDLPEGAKTESEKTDVGDKGVFLEKLISTLKLTAPVIVSPSMSGGYSLPYLFKDPSTVQKRSRGFVPVAPVHTEDYKAEEYKSLHIPTAIVYGENDQTIGPVSTRNLKNLPNSELHEIKGAGHPAWINKPDEFHDILYKFLHKNLATAP